MNYKTSYTDNLNNVNEDQYQHIGFVNKSEDEKLKENIFSPPMEKLSSFTRMIRRELVFKKAKVIHK